MQQPSIGRDVHYTSYGTPGGEYKSACRAAKITEVGEYPDAADSVSLCVFNPTGLFYNEDVRHDEDKAPGTWHWPEQVGAVRTWDKPGG